MSLIGFLYNERTGYMKKKKRTRSGGIKRQREKRIDFLHKRMRHHMTRLWMGHPIAPLHIAAVDQ